MRIVVHGTVGGLPMGTRRVGAFLRILALDLIAAAHSKAPSDARRGLRHNSLLFQRAAPRTALMRYPNDAFRLRSLSTEAAGLGRGWGGARPADRSRLPGFWSSSHGTVARSAAAAAGSDQVADGVRTTIRYLLTVPPPWPTYFSVGRVLENDPRFRKGFYILACV